MHDVYAKVRALGAFLLHVFSLLFFYTHPLTILFLYKDSATVLRSDALFRRLTTSAARQAHGNDIAVVGVHGRHGASGAEVLVKVQVHVCEIWFKFFFFFAHFRRDWGRAGCAPAATRTSWNTHIVRLVPKASFVVTLYQCRQICTSDKPNGA